MALSKKVDEYLVEAQGNIRNALAYAARSERPVTCLLYTSDAADE